MSDAPPPIVVLMLTYGGTVERRRYARQTLDTLIRHIHYSGTLRLHIADDGSPDGHVSELAQTASRGPFISTTTTNANRAGYGASYNAATMIVHDLGAMALVLEDDWELTRPLDLDPLARALLEPCGEAGPIGCIRLGYLGFWSPIRGTFIHCAGQTFIMLDPESPSGDVFAGHPRLETVEWERWVGLWPEGLSAQETELAVCGRERARTGVVWPCDLVLTQGGLWAHVGTVKAPNPGEG